MTGHGNLLYEKNKEGTKIKNENGETYCRQFGQSRPLWGGYVLKEGLSHLTGGGHSIQMGDFMLRPGVGNVPGLFKELEDDQCDQKMMRWEQSSSGDVNRAQRVQEL